MKGYSLFEAAGSLLLPLDISIIMILLLLADWLCLLLSMIVHTAYSIVNIFVNSRLVKSQCRDVMAGGKRMPIAICFITCLLSFKYSTGRIPHHAGQAATENTLQENYEPAILSPSLSSCRRMAAPGRPVVC